MMNTSRRSFATNVSTSEIVDGRAKATEYVWDSEAISDFTIVLNAASELEDSGWSVGINCPSGGVQRRHRIPIVAVKGDEILLIKPVQNPKKVNISGLKLLDLQVVVQANHPSHRIKSVVYGFFADFDDIRRTSESYEIWLRE